MKAHSVKCRAFWFAYLAIPSLIVHAASLQIGRTQNVVQCSWPAAASSYSLEFTESMVSNSWMPVTNQPTIQNNLKFVVDPANVPARFYRLSASSPSPPVLTNLTAPTSVVHGALLSIGFDYADPDGDVEKALMTMIHTLASLSDESPASAFHIAGEAGHATLTLDTGPLPYGTLELSLQLRDAVGLYSEITNFNVEITGANLGGEPPAVVAFSRPFGSFEKPAGYGRVPVFCALQLADPDGDLDFIRLTIYPPPGDPLVSDLAATALGYTGSGGAVTSTLMEFTSASIPGPYTLEVIPFDGDGHAGDPAYVSIFLSNFGGEVLSLNLASVSTNEAAPGVDVSINGTGFDTNSLAPTTFALGEIPCEVVSLTPDQATLRIPVGARTGAFTARNPNGVWTVGSQSVTVPEHIVIEPAPDEPVTLSVGATATFRAVIGSARLNRDLSWRVNGVPGGNVTFGTISAVGVYTAPPAIPTNSSVLITASIDTAPVVVSPATPVTIVPPPAMPGARRILAAIGGTVSSTDFLARVVIPPGALASNTVITARTLAPAELPAAGPGRRSIGGAEFGPPGTIFTTPVMASIPLLVARATGTVLRCRYYNPAGGTFLDEGIFATVDSSGAAAQAPLVHFSFPVLDESAPASPPTNAPILLTIEPAVIEEGARLPVRITGTGLTDDLRVEIREAGGALAGGMRVGTLFALGNRAGFVLDAGVLPGFDTGTLGFKVRLIRTQNETLFAEIPFDVQGLPEFIVSSGETTNLVNPSLLRVSRVSIGNGATVHVVSGALELDSLGDVQIIGKIDARGNRGADGHQLAGGEGTFTGGAGAKGCEGLVVVNGIPFPDLATFGAHGIDPVGTPSPYQAPARPLDALTRAPRGLGGEPGASANFDPGSVLSAVTECILTLGIACPAAIAALINEISNVLTITSGATDGRPGLGAPAKSVTNTPGGGGGGGGGQLRVSIFGVGGISIAGGGGGAGGDGGSTISIRSARAVTGPDALISTAPILDARGGDGGDGSRTSHLRVSAVFGLVTVYTNEDADAFTGGGGGGGRSGFLRVTGTEGVYVDSDTDRLRVGGGIGGRGGVVDFDVEDDRIRQTYAISPAANGEILKQARLVHRPFFGVTDFSPQVRTRALLRLVSVPTYDRSAVGAVLFDIVGSGPGQHRIVTAHFNADTTRYEALALFYPGFNTFEDPDIGSRDPLDAPKVLVLGDDADADGLTTDDEFDLGTLPGSADTDADGQNDGAEVLAGTNPLAPPAARPDLTFSPVFSNGNVNAIINALAVQPDRKVVVGGQFTHVQGISQRGIARLETNGLLDVAFNPGGTGSDGPVYSVAIQRDGRILIGGQFNNVGGQSRYRLARLHADGSVESTNTFNPRIAAPGQVNCMALQPDGRIVIGGTFTTVGGQLRRCVARLNADGSLDGSFNPGAGAQDTFGGYVFATAVQPDGKILIGGDFATVDNQPRENLARLYANGSVESNLTFNIGTGFSAQVNCIALQRDGKILVGGDFTVVDGQARTRIARLNVDGSLVGIDTFGQGANGFISSLAVQADGRIIVAGAFNTFDGQARGRVARLLPDTTLESVGGFDPLGGANDFVNALALQDDGWILIGGQYTNMAGQARSGLARLKNDAIAQNLTALGNTTVAWMRSGAAPELGDTSFDFAAGGGTNWITLGLGARITGGWQLTGLTLSTNGTLRARGRTAGGENNGSAGLVEQASAFTTP